MKYAYNHWRRAFGGPGAELCSGILVWQLNDIWPGTSWALVDSEMSLKPSFHITKRALAKVVVGVERLVTKKTPYMVTSYPPSKTRAAIWAVNGYTSALPATLHLSAFDIETGSSIALPDDVRTRNVMLKPNQTTEIVGGVDIPDADTTVLYASLLGEGERGEQVQLARWVDWPEPLKFVHFAKDVSITTRLVASMETGDGKEVIVLKADRPLKGVVLSIPISAGGEDAIWDDNFIDLVPGEEIRVGVRGLDGREGKIETRWLCDWEGEEGFEL